MRWRWMAGAMLAGISAGASADLPAASRSISAAAPSAVSVVIYRMPGRSAEAPINLGWTQGYALITETRDIDLPAGVSEVRFEGVAAGMLAESVVVQGLPGSVREKNLDADLLSARTLFAHAYGRPVILQRTDASGHVREEQAIVRSGEQGPAIVQTSAGFEMADCGGLHDALAYQGAPVGLNAKPTLSILTEAAAPAHVRVRLSYLAWGFDWQAAYVMQMRPGARAADLTAWVTMANADPTGFERAQVAVVAGRSRFSESPRWSRAVEPLALQCSIWPVTPPVETPAPRVRVKMIVPPAPMAAAMMRADAAPVAMRAETLGDLKLYRMPQASTLAAHAQKQVALFAGRRVRMTLIYKADLAGRTAEEPVRETVRLRNRRSDGLGLALPAGQVRLMQPQGGALIPAAAGHIDDKAEGERIDIELGAAGAVRMATLAGPGRRTSHMLVNANAWPIRFEGKLAPGGNPRGASQTLMREDGAWVWRTVVPAHGRARLSYTR